MCLVLLLLAGAGGLRSPTASRRTLGVRFAQPSSAAPPSGELSKAVWAVAANFDGPGRLLEPLKSAGLRQVAEFDARALVDTAFAYAESGVDAADLFDTIEAAAAAPAATAGRAQSRRQGGLNRRQRGVHLPVPRPQTSVSLHSIGQPDAHGRAT